MIHQRISFVYRLYINQVTSNTPFVYRHRKKTAALKGELAHPGSKPVTTGRNKRPSRNVGNAEFYEGRVHILTNPTRESRNEEEADEVRTGVGNHYGGGKIVRESNEGPKLVTLLTGSTRPGCSVIWKYNSVKNFAKRNLSPMHTSWEDIEQMPQGQRQRKRSRRGRLQNKNYASWMKPRSHSVIGTKKVK